MTHDLAADWPSTGIVRRDGWQRRAILDAAELLFAQQGYGATGLIQIIDKSGTSRGSFYHYFPDGKAELGAQVVARRSERVLQRIRAAFAQAQSFEAGAQALADVMGKAFASNAVTCPIAAVLMSVGPHEDGLRRACCAAYGDWRGELERAASRFGEDASLARLLMISLIGAWIVGRAEGDPKAFAIAAQAVRARD